MGKINWSRLNESEIVEVKSAIRLSEIFYGYIPEKGFQFILDNFHALKEIGVLELNWMLAYTHASDFSKTPLERLKEVFDLCDKSILQKEYPIYVGDHFSNGERFSLFRGCAGGDHRMGMSWTSSLDKAIWYAAKHKEYNGLSNLAVYAAVVDRNEIYCCGNHYDYDFIVYPKEVWSIAVPEKEFRLDRPR